MRQQQLSCQHGPQCCHSRCRLHGALSRQRPARRVGLACAHASKKHNQENNMRPGHAALAPLAAPRRCLGLRRTQRGSGAALLTASSGASVLQLPMAGHAHFAAAPSRKRKKQRDQRPRESRAPTPPAKTPPQPRTHTPRPQARQHQQGANPTASTERTKKHNGRKPRTHTTRPRSKPREAGRGEGTGEERGGERAGGEGREVPRA